MPRNLSFFLMMKFSRIVKNFQRAVIFLWHVNKIFPLAYIFSLSLVLFSWSFCLFYIFIEAGLCFTDVCVLWYTVICFFFNVFFFYSSSLSYRDKSFIQDRYAFFDMDTDCYTLTAKYYIYRVSTLIYFKYVMSPLWFISKKFNLLLQSQPQRYMSIILALGHLKQE